MLKSVRLKDFAIFKDVTIPFAENLCVISGETGAGKSIMVDGMLTLLGAKADSGVVRDGAPEAVVEGLFEIVNYPAVQGFLKEHGFEPSTELVIKRVINIQGKSRVTINGSASTLSMLSGLSKLLVDIHGQHEHQSLLDPTTHIRLLDAYAGLEGPAGEVQTQFMDLKNIMDTLGKMQSRLAVSKKEEELIRFQLSEINAANLKPDEDILLEKEYSILSHAQRLMSELNTVYEAMSGEGNSVIANMHRAIKAMTGLQDIDPSLKQYSGRLDAVFVELKDIASDINSYLSRIELDPQKLDQTEQRIELLDRLKKKYGKAIGDIIEYAGSAEKQLKEFGSMDKDIGELQQRKTTLERGLYRQAEELSKARKNAASGLGKKIAHELKTLGMKDAVFESRVGNLEAKDAVEINNRLINADGADRVAFYFSANPGFSPKPLTEIISGGELSRTMLAIKKVLVKASPVPILVFDEIDTGIGGQTAEIVGKKLKELSDYHQVICITHLHQIAGFGDYHINVSKSVSGGRTDVVIKVLDEKERVDEIARMLSGETVTELGRKQAREFLKYVKEIKC